MLRKTNTTPLTDLTQGEAKRAGTAPRRQLVGRLRFQEGERGGSVPGLGFRVFDLSLFKRNRACRFRYEIGAQASGDARALRHPGSSTRSTTGKILCQSSEVVRLPFSASRASPLAFQVAQCSGFAFAEATAAISAPSISPRLRVSSPTRSKRMPC